MQDTQNNQVSNPDLEEKILATALEYAKLGCPVLPCTKNKNPHSDPVSIPNGFKNASTNPETIKSWWKKWKTAMIGVPTGPASGNGANIFVLDVDERPATETKPAVHGIISLQNLEKQYDKLPITRRHKTPSGGYHYFFKYPQGILIPNSTAQLGKGLDIKGATPDKSTGQLVPAGYVIVPPSINAEGKAYTVDVDAPIAQAPEWLLNLAMKHSQEPSKQENAPAQKNQIPQAQLPPKKKWGKKAKDTLNKVIEKLKNTQYDQNDALNNSAFILGTFVGQGLLDRRFVEEKLWAACETNGYIAKDGAEQTRATIKSGLESGILKGISLPQKNNDGTANEDDRVRILYSVDKNPNTVLREIENVLKTTIYLYNGMLVRIIPHTKTTPCTISPIFSQDELFGYIRRRIIFIQIEYHENPNGTITAKEKEILPPTEVIKTLFTQSNNLDFDVIENGIVESPIFREDGTVIDQPGYDPQMKVYCDFDPADFQDINLPIDPDPEKAKAFARQQLEILADALSEFPFPDKLSKYCAFALLLTPFIQKIVPKAPLFAVTAPKSGTGKSTLVDLASILATGRPAPAMAYTRDQSEFEKEIFAVLLAAKLMELIDDVKGIFNNKKFDTMLTAETFSGRVLGLSKQVEIPSRTLWIIAGKNLRLTDDMIRRTILIELVRDMERPRNFPFKRSLKRWVKQKKVRAKYVSAAINFLRAYRIAGTPLRGNIPSFNGFEEWSEEIREPLLWISADDPEEQNKPIDILDSQLKIEENDPERDSMIQVFTEWWKEYADRWVTASELLNQNKELYDILKDSVLSPLNGKEINNKSLGKQLDQHQKSVFGDWKIEKTLDAHTKIFFYRLVLVNQQNE